MKRTLAMIAVALFTAGTAAAVFAQTPAAPRTEAKKPSAKSNSGTVKSASADSLVVSGKDKGKDAEWTFALDAKTKVTKAGKTITPADIKAGDAVQVRYIEEGGKSTAQTVAVRPPAPAKKAEAKAAEKKP